MTDEMRIEMSRMKKDSVIRKGRIGKEVTAVGHGEQLGDWTADIGSDLEKRCFYARFLVRRPLGRALTHCFVE